ncbi:heme-binding protein, partial [Acinetobacter baumannii]|nr:heme-binding protein [Acinetobacter baumannii]
MGMNLKLKFFKLAILSLAITSVPCAYAITTAQPNKILHVAYEAPDDGFDMVKTTNFYSANIAEAIFEPLLKYDYLARPLQLVPNTVESLPKVEQDGKVYIFKTLYTTNFTEPLSYQGSA